MADSIARRFILGCLAERGITVSREAICLWCIKFGASFGSQTLRIIPTDYEAAGVCSGLIKPDTNLGGKIATKRGVQWQDYDDLTIRISSVKRSDFTACARWKFIRSTDVAIVGITST
jgi:hypothetical protein